MVRRECHDAPVRPPRPVLAVAAWAVAVSAAALVIWLVIANVGTSLTAEQGPVIAGRGGSTALVRTPTPSSRRTTATPQRSARRSSTPPARPTRAVTRTSANPASTSAVKPPKPTTARTTPPPASRRSTPPAALTTATWVGGAGRVTTACQGGHIWLQAAVPANGYRVEVSDRGPQRVEVKFESSESSEVEVSATCARRGPVYTVSSD